MKSDDLFDAIGNVDSDMILNAKSPPKKKVFYKKTAWISAIAAMLVLSLVLGSFLLPGSQTALSAYALAEAEYPNDVPYPGNELSADYDARFDAWHKHNRTQKQAFNDLGVNIDEFLYRSIGEFLSAKEGENVVFSPLNVYMAFAMLAELTDNTSRQQILDVLGCDNVETLRKEASALWQANYSDDGLVTTVLASSVWLSDQYTYKKDTLKQLADIYYASSFSGEMGSDKYNKRLQSWLNEQTGGLLKDSAEAIEMTQDTIMALATTIYYQARWLDPFSKNDTQQSVFHTPNGDVTCDFMKQSGKDLCYFGEQFTAVRKGLGSGDQSAMWLILPNEGVSPEELLVNEEAMTFLTKNQKWKNTKETIVHLSVPKFDVTSDLDLREGMQNLGITDIFDGILSDFSPMTDARDDIFVDTANHSARVTIDEEGCTATAFTVIGMAGESVVSNEINFTLDRPFLFVITSDVGLPLFVGTVNQPQ